MFENRFAERASLLQTESAFQILAHANDLEARGRSIIHCEIGQPDFHTPQFIIDAAYKAMNDGYTCYTPTKGYPEVREVIAEHVKQVKNVDADKDEIVIVPGGKPVMFYTMQMLVEPGDEVIYPNPGFPIYESCIRYAGGVPVPMPLLEDRGFRPDWEDLKKRISPKTKLIIINSPSNPTGGVFSRADIETVADILRERPDIYILSDEIYERLSYDEKPFSIASLPGFKDRTIILDGFSKAYAMTGWRVGYAVLNKGLADCMEMLMVNSNSCTAAFTQIAAAEAYKGPQDFVEEMRQTFLERRDYVVSALNSIPGVHCNTPHGAFYAFPNISSFGLGDHEFCHRLLEEEGVAAAWGTSFGSYGKGFMRLSYATALDNLKEGIDRIARFCAKL